MAETQADVNYPVYTGVWTNWARGGRIKGSTITLTHHDGALLTAFLAVFIAFTGSKLWRVVCFGLFQFLQSRPGISQDGLYHQRQAVLRNATDEKIGFLSLLRILLAWRRRARRPFFRMIPIVALSLLLVIAITVASLFSSQISSVMGNEVLISSPDCGIPGETLGANPTYEQGSTIFNPWTTEQLTSWANYAQRCYSSTSGSSPTSRNSCVPFVKARLSSSIDRNASCPFDEELCRYKNGNIKIDSGYIDSQDLGLNLPANLRFSFRKVLQCAPLASENYQKTVYYSQEKPYTRYFLGSQIHRGLPFTYEVEQQSAEELAWQNASTALADYGIQSLACLINNGTCDPFKSAFVPIKELAPTDGDVTLIFLSANGIRYTNATDDSWYAAHRTTNGIVNGFGNDLNPGSIDYFLPDQPASVLGCKEQYQTCDPTLPPAQGCSPLDGVQNSALNGVNLKTEREMAIAWGAVNWAMKSVLNALRSNALLARLSLLNDVQSPLPTNQWQLEVENWHNITMAIFQGAVIQDAIGPGNPDMLKYFWTKPSSDLEKYICKNQKIISTTYTNFSTMWLVIVLVLGSLIITIEQTLETSLPWLERHNIIKTSTTEWFGNDTLQLQRMAHEELGLGDWEGCRGKAIPVTKTGQLLGTFSIADSEHPKLVNPSLLAESLSPSVTKSTVSSDDKAGTAGGKEIAVKALSA
ncbi:MAG: hypothetical protein Q9160_003957 [Pyrenula sp. 1 TL-2023]